MHESNDQESGGIDCRSYLQIKELPINNEWQIMRRHTELDDVRKLYELQCIIICSTSKDIQG